MTAIDYCHIRRRAFTLIEMIVATLIAAMLTGAVLAAVAGIGRDRKRMNAEAAVNVSPQWLDLLRRDLTNATSMSATEGGVALEGNAGIDAKSLTPNNRLVRVVYRARENDDATTTLVREQRYLDDAIRPEPWSEIVAAGVTRITLTPASADFEVIRDANKSAPVRLKVPTRVKVHLDTASGAVDEEMWVK
jgi:prepilin-type N-terminal cleavage/methylation domain-containing protein